MNYLGRALLMAVLVYLFCSCSISAKEGEREGASTPRVATATTLNTAEPLPSTPAVPKLPTRPVTTPEAGEQIDWWVISGGGSSGVSASYQLVGTVGQTSVDFGTSDNYQVQGGFWQPASGASGCCEGRVGDANGLGGDEPSIGDISVMIDAKFITSDCVGPSPENPIIACLAEADINQSGGIDPVCDDISIGDISILIDYLFITGSSLGLNDCL